MNTNTTHQGAVTSDVCSGRRALLRLSGAAAFVGGLWIVLPATVLAGSHRKSFDARSVNDALAAAGMTDAAPSPALRIDAAEIVENAGVFPVQITSAIPDTRALALVIDRNPFPYIARITFSPPAAAYIGLRVRVAETSQLRVLAATRDGLYVATKSITSAAGGCAGGDAEAPRYQDPPPPIKMRSSQQGKRAEVRILLNHPMENGLRTDAAGKTIPERFIQTLVVRLNDQTILGAEFGRSVSADPLITFRLADAKVGDVLNISWQDTHGASRRDEIKLGA